MSVGCRDCRSAVRAAARLDRAVPSVETTLWSSCSEALPLRLDGSPALVPRMRSQQTGALRSRRCGFRWRNRNAHRDRKDRGSRYPRFASRSRGAARLHRGQGNDVPSAAPVAGFAQEQSRRERQPTRLLLVQRRSAGVGSRRARSRVNAGVVSCPGCRPLIGHFIGRVLLDTLQANTGKSGSYAGKVPGEGSACDTGTGCTPVGGRLSVGVFSR